MQDIKGTILNLTKNVTKTSGDLLKTTKLSLALSTEETNLKNQPKKPLHRHRQKSA